MKPWGSDIFVFKKGEELRVHTENVIQVGFTFGETDTARRVE
jgi:hypothetical protein